MTLLARLIANEEGFGIAGNQPTRKHNPGDLRHSPHSSHDGENPNDIGIIATDAGGWADLERQLQIYGERGLTLEEAIYEFAPPSDFNDSAAYLKYVCNGLRCDPSILVADALKIS